MNNGIIGFPLPHRYVSEFQPLVIGANITFQLPIPTAPDLITVRLLCMVAGIGYVPGDIVIPGANDFTPLVSAREACTISVNTTPNVTRRDTFADGAIAAAAWRIQVICTWSSP